MRLWNQVASMFEFAQGEIGNMDMKNVVVRTRMALSLFLPCDTAWNGF